MIKKKDLKEGQELYLVRAKSSPAKNKVTITYYGKCHVVSLHPVVTVKTKSLYVTPVRLVYNGEDFLFLTEAEAMEKIKDVLSIC